MRLDSADSDRLSLLRSVTRKRLAEQPMRPRTEAGCPHQIGSQAAPDHQAKVSGSHQADQEILRPWLRMNRPRAGESTRDEIGGDEEKDAEAAQTPQAG